MQRHSRASGSTFRRLIQGHVAIRIWAAIAIPTVAALAILLVLDAQLLTASAGSRAMKQASTVVTDTNLAIRDLQLERGISVTTLAATDAAALAQRREKRAAADASHQALESAVQRFLTAMPAAARDQWQAADADWSTLQGLRNKIDAGGVESSTVIGTYTKAVDKLIRLQDQLQALAVSADVTRDFSTLLGLVRAGESAGRERASAALAIAGGTLSPAIRKRLGDLAVDQEVRLGNVADQSVPWLQDALTQAQDDPAFGEVRRLRALINGGDISGVTPDMWFNAASARIVLINGLADRIGQEMADLALQGEQAQQVQGLLDAMAHEVGALGHVLTKVVRTATPDVNRRASPRYAISAKATLEVGPATLQGELADISVGGARILGLPPVQPGQSVTLKVDNVVVPATVIRGDGSSWRIRIDEQFEDKVGPRTSQRGDKSAA